MAARSAGSDAGSRPGVLERLGRYRFALGALILFLLYPLLDHNAGHVNAAADAAVFALLALGLNIVVGFAGLLDLGYAAFFAIGSYTYALSASPFYNVHMPFWPMLFLGAIIAGISGALLGAPTLRLRGDYLAIVTLGFGEIVPTVFLNLPKYTGGTNGVVGIDKPTVFGYSFGFNPVPYYYTLIVILVFSVIAVLRLRDSRLGRAWLAVREDETAAASMGINLTTTKLLAFSFGAFFSGFGGALYVAKLGVVSPEQFNFTVSFTILAMVVLGGMGSVFGVIAGAAILYEFQTLFLNDLTQWSHAIGTAWGIPLLTRLNFVDLKFLLYGLGLILLMLLRPEGLFPERRTRAIITERVAAEIPPEDVSAAAGATGAAESPTEDGA
ncbi:MAG TPA: branched-chain amino acid ABC transporter permease [bacterium]|nr:branched-chain amino acid ABC transporter permease [bacterium]